MIPGQTTTQFPFALIRAIRGQKIFFGKRMNIQQSNDDISGAIRSPVGRQKLGDPSQIVAGSDQAVFDVPGISYLWMPGVRQKRVAETFPAGGVLLLPALGDIHGYRLPGTTEINLAIRGPEGFAQISKIADARPGQIRFIV
jgi:hypothetical protein